MTPTQQVGERREAMVREIAADVMQWGAPHFKHMVSFNTLCEAIEGTLRRLDPPTFSEDEAGKQGVTGAPPLAEPALVQAPSPAVSALTGFDPARMAVARCVEIAREVRDGFLSPEYATDQPLSSVSERFACDQVARAIEDEFALGTVEQCQLLSKLTPFERESGQ